MKYIFYKPAREKYDNKTQHVLWYVVDEKLGVCRYYLKSQGGHRWRCREEQISIGSYGIFGTEVVLYDISQPNLEKWAEKLKDAFVRNRDEIRRICIDYRSQFPPEKEPSILDDSFIGCWKD